MIAEFCLSYGFGAAVERLGPDGGMLERPKDDGFMGAGYRAHS